MDSSARPTSLAAYDQTAGSGVFRRMTEKVVNIAAAPQVLALADQALVSGASFLTTVFIGRYTVPNQLGTYALAGAALVWLTNAQESLVSLPYTIRRSDESGLPAVQAGQALVLTGLLSALAAGAIGLAGVAVLLWGSDHDAIAILCALGVTAPFVIYRDFARRFAFADLRNIEALALDCAIVFLQVGALGWLAWTDQLTSVTALTALGFACAASVLIWLVLVRDRFRFTHERFLETARNSWALGKWLFANQLLIALQAQMTLWCVALIVGTAATGIYTACMTIALFTNPIILGISNMLWAKAARAFQAGGSARLLRESIADAAQLGVIVGVFCLAILIWDEDLLRWLYSSSEYGGYGHVVSILAFGQFLYAIGMPASAALAGMGKVRTNFLLAAGEVALVALLVWPLVAYWGIVGAAYGTLVGCVLRLLIRWSAVVVMLNSASRMMDCSASLEALAPLLRRLPRGAEPLKAEALDLDGCQGHIFAAKAGTANGDAEAACIIKLYRTDRNLDAAEIHAQYETLHRLHAKLNGRVVRGWTIYVPMPVLVSETPLALVMMRVPGRKLVTCLYDRGPGAAVEHPSAVAVADALTKLWTAGLFHGDLTIENILCDEPTRSLSFVDCGPKTECASYAKSRHRWDLAAHDLAHLLSHEGETVFATWGRSKRRQQRQLFVEGVLRAVLASEPSYAAKSVFLAKLHCCAQAHLAALKPIYHPYGLWRALKHRACLRRINAITERMAKEIVAEAASMRESGSLRCAANVACNSPDHRGA